jgi:hypothetical protein
VLQFSKRVDVTYIHCDELFGNMDIFGSNPNCLLTERSPKGKIEVVLGAGAQYTDTAELKVDRLYTSTTPIACGSINPIQIDLAYKHEIGITARIVSSQTAIALNCSNNESVLSLNGSTSCDSIGSNLSYHWAFTADSDLDVVTTYTDQMAKALEIPYDILEPSTFNVTLTVANSFGHTSKQTVTIEVLAESLPIP